MVSEKKGKLKKKCKIYSASLYCLKYTKQNEKDLRKFRCIRLLLISLFRSGGAFLWSCGVYHH